MTDHPDPYTSPSMPVDRGEGKGIVQEDGSISWFYEEAADKNPRFKKWAGSEAMQAVDDSKIVKYGENSHAEYWRIGMHITVTWMAGYQLYCCLECRTNSCKHTKRIEAFREGKPEEAAE